MNSERIVPLIVAQRRPTTPQQRVAYELARLRVAATHAPSPRLAHLARAHD